VKLPLSLAIVVAVATAAMGRTAPAADGPPQTSHPAGRPHPAVVRVITAQHDGASYGSGALVAVGREHGLVVTNWHVVRDAAGPVLVVFPDGFRSAATVLKIDRDWDLAALAIWRPNCEPIRLSRQTPRPGEPLTIAGYGRGQYRVATGRCTQYVSPGGNQPFEMVELGAAARDGDSGGPIFNSRGELAGVLFGAARGRTTGSYCGRVRRFLGSVSDSFDHLPPGPGTMIARRPEPVRDRTEPLPPRPPDPPPPLPLAEVPAREPADWESSPSPPGAETSGSGLTASLSVPPAGSQTAGSEAGRPVAGSEAGTPNRGDQIKNILAAIGVVALLFHGLRLLASLQGS